MDFLTEMMKWVDPLAIVLAYAFTQLIKYYMCPPTGILHCEKGTFQNRIMPIIPLLIGTVVALMNIPGGLVKLSQGSGQLVIKGVVSGIAASYFYRTWKVTIFGE